MNNSIEETCPICLINTINVTILCNHKFCSTCIYRWVEMNSSCPICRFQNNLIIDYSQVNNYIQELRDVKLSVNDNNITRNLFSDD
jgi:hypothetical protein